MDSEVYKAGIDASKDLVKEMIAKGFEIGKKEISKIATDFDFAFRRFLERNEKKISKVKLILNPAKPILISKFFEPPLFAIGETRFSTDAFIDKLDELKYVVITGIGGSGKSIFLKHLFHIFKSQKRNKIPFYVELRNIKDAELIDYLSLQITSIRSSITRDSFEHALNTGRFIFLFDGLDEVDPKFREKLVNQLHTMVYSFEDNIYIVSSRPDLNLSAWNEFSDAEIKGFSEEQVVSLVQKIEYDKTTKSKFVERVKDGLYETHGAYLSNPLLCMIMLMTFEGGAEIPLSLHLFFAQAFDVLFYKHDATKGDSYKRKFHTSLDIERFKQVFSAFSLFSYIDAGSSMKSDQALACAMRGIEFFNQDCNSADFLTDLVGSLSIMIKDADQYYYIHRTFQEYFVALFLAREDFDGWEKVVHETNVMKTNDKVVDMLADMNSEKFDNMYLKGKLKELRPKLNKVQDSVKKTLLMFYSHVDIHERGCSALTIRDMSNFAVLSSLEKQNRLPVAKLSWTGDYRDLIAAQGSEAQVRAGSYREDGIVIDIAAQSEEVLAASPLKTHAEAIRASVNEKIVEIEEREKLKKKLVASQVIAKLPARRR